MAGSPERIAVFGAGYVGLVTGACLADLGHTVVVRDVVTERIDALRRGEVPIYEPGLDELIARNRERLTFTTDVAEAVEGASVVYVAVGTPPTYSGDADLTAVWTVVDELPPVDHRIVLVMKSTVPVGTGERVRHRLAERGLENVGYASNPEFTAEGTAVRDFMHPDRIVVGAFEEADGDRVAALHAGIEAPIVRCDVASAEMIKLAANAALMTRISFINEIANVCEATGADVVRVAEGVGLDRRIGPSFLRAGIGFGGSCLLGDETVLVRTGRGSRMVTLEALYEQTEPLDDVEILTWQPGCDGPEYLPVDVLTRRHYNGDVVTVRTKMGRAVTTTADHPFVVRDGSRVLAEDLTTQDWVPLARGAADSSRRSSRWLWLLEDLDAAALDPSDVIVRPRADELAGVAAEVPATMSQLGHPRGKNHGYDILRSQALRLDEAAALDIELTDATFGTAKNGTYVPAAIESSPAFWRVAGLYTAEGHHAIDGRRHRLVWSFHPRDEEHLVEEVAGFWRALGVKATVRAHPTSRRVSVSSRLLGSWWTGVLGMGSDSYRQRVPDRLWDEPPEHRWAFLTGLWHGDGSWSLINGGPSVVLELGTASRELADGVLRLLGDLGLVASQRVGRTSKSTVDTFWLRLSGAEQVERAIGLVQPGDRATVLASVAGQAKRIAPTGYRVADNASWVRVTATERRPYSGFVYSLEVPPAHTFVTTGGLVTSNCFPKDSLALKQLAANSGYHFQLLNAVIEVNELQKRRVIGKLQEHLGALRDTTIALLGVAFKPDTDDVREAPSLVLAGRLLAEGANVRAWDPVATFDGLHGVEQVGSIAEAVAGADAAVVVTEWPAIAEQDWAALGATMKRRVFVDGRNMLDPAAMRDAGFAYDGIGRGAA